MKERELRLGKETRRFELKELTSGQIDDLTKGIQSGNISY